MKILLPALVGLLSLTSCSPADPPPAAVVQRKPAPASPPAQSPRPRPVEAEPPMAPKPPEATRPEPLSEPPQPKLSEVRRATPPEVPRAQGLSGDIHLPSFTFRSLAGGAQIQINAQVLGTAPCMWTVTNALDFDPKIRVASWPPDGAFKIGSTQHRENGSADLWLDQSDTVRSRFPHLRPGEVVLYVDGTLGGKNVRGALRLFVEGFKYSVYTPLVNPEGEEASRYVRTIWFDRIRNE